MIRIIFMGTPEFAANHLSALLQHPDKYEISAVLTRPDKPKGRKRKRTPSPVKETAQEKGLKVLQPSSLKDEAILNQLRESKPDFFIVVAYGLILGDPVLQIPKYGCINIHASLLPELRGASPIQTALLQGKTWTGVTSMKMDSGIDTGNILLQNEVPIDPTDDTQSLTNKLSTTGKQCLLDTLERLKIVNYSWEGNAQKNEYASYAGKIKKELAYLDFNKSAKTLHNQVRALNTWPVCRIQLPDVSGTSYDLQILKTSVEAYPEQSTKKPPTGTIRMETNKTLAIHTGGGNQLLNLLTVQLPGKKPMPVQAFLNGHKVLNGSLAVSPHPGNPLPPHN